MGTIAVGRERRDVGILPYDACTSPNDAQIPPGNAHIVSGTIPVGRDAHIPPVNTHIPPVNARTYPNDAHIPPIIKLTDIGTIMDKYIQRINTVYDNVSVDKYIIMPDHVHLLISIYASDGDGGMRVARVAGGDGGMRASRPTLHTVVRSLKTMVTKQIGYSIWQDSYYDKIIRDERGYREIWQYIDENPLRLLENEDRNGL